MPVISPELYEKIVKAGHKITEYVDIKGIANDIHSTFRGNARTRHARELHIGPRGGVFYYGVNNRRVYINKHTWK